MTIEEQVGEIIEKVLKVPCEVRRSDDDKLVTKANIYPLPMVGDYLSFSSPTDGKFLVVSREFTERDMFDLESKWILYVREIKE